MPHLQIHLHSPLHDSFRVRQVAGMFDLPLRDCVEERFDVELPDESESWQIGAIVGPSGSGKTAVARHAFAENLYRGQPWPTDRAVIDCFGDLPIKQITHALTAVGLGSPPSWLKTFEVLSNGEKFRCELARALLCRSECNPESANEKLKMKNEKCEDPDPSFFTEHANGKLTAKNEKSGDPHFSFSIFHFSFGPTVVFDEYSSFVDRTVARISSAAIARAIRSGKFATRFVAVTCHKDVLPWLAPDWVLDMSSGKLARGSAARPPIHLKIRKAQRDEWNLFCRHHYLSGSLHRAAQCYIAQYDGQPAAFCAALPFPHPRRPGWREHRTVCLPDFQGVGIGHALAEFVASLYVATGKPYFSRSSHPAILRHRASSPLWKMTCRPGLVRPISASGRERTGLQQTLSAMRLTTGFEYVGPPRHEAAKRLRIP
ncbi:MAG TPA: GNAT family N-acetyltransferase [Humisphaera sp.]|jgi:GNAT superfamily N-acetyltransferase|nr:GNAT family N-acetyltransferase [Humisphaera sp.]